MNTYKKQKANRYQKHSGFEWTNTDTLIEAYQEKTFTICLNGFELYTEGICVVRNGIWVQTKQCNVPNTCDC